MSKMKHNIYMYAFGRPVVLPVPRVNILCRVPKKNLSLYIKMNINKNINTHTHIYIYKCISFYGEQ